MNKILILACIGWCVLVMAGCATSEAAKPAADETIKLQRCSYWQQENAAQIAEATRPEVLAKFCESYEAASAALAKVGPAYTTDPVYLTQIAAVSQLVMCNKCPKAPRYRIIWAAALERARDAAADEYRRAFFADQLRWCGFAK